MIIAAVDSTQESETPRGLRLAARRARSIGGIAVLSTEYVKVAIRDYGNMGLHVLHVV
jgi:hypothetical protein